MQYSPITCAVGAIDFNDGMVARDYFYSSFRFDCAKSCGKHKKLAYRYRKLYEIRGTELAESNATLGGIVDWFSADESKFVV